MNQKVLAMNCLKNILILHHLLIWQKKLYKLKNEKENNELVNVIKSGIIDLKHEIEKMPENEKTDKILKIVEE